ncbi:hypothetical protein SAMN05216436_1403 [bacterium A37T11]|nr:hypothetical protein SAMN05216436_1403 [bacterium A37T11]
MADDFKLFTIEVKNLYEKKVANGEMPPGLDKITSAKIMRYLIPRLGKEMLKNDIPTLERIFNPVGVYKSLEKAIEDFHKQEKFKPLLNFVNGITINTDDNFVKLLAILIDFQPRPYDKWKAESKNNENEKCEGLNEIPIISLEDDSIQDFGSAPATERKTKSDNEDPQKPPIGTKWAWSKGKKPLIYVLTISAVCLGSYFITQSHDRQCMYWAGDHYSPVACLDTSIHVDKMALDEHLVITFKRITRPDTLKKNSIRKVWYVKIDDDSLEYYTAPGYYPLDNHKILKPLTEYIFDKYILKVYSH